MPERQLILIEFNELCPSLLDRWMADGSLPNFKRFYDESTVFVSSPDVDEQVYLEPWIQWYSIHTGLRQDQHSVFRLTDGPRAGHEDIWTLLLNNGLRVGSFSSMNVRRFEANDSFFVSDPWCASEQAYPPELDAYQQYVSAAVQGYTEPQKGEKAVNHLEFMKFLMSHGLKVSTIRKLAFQILSEKISPADYKWRRASQLDAIQYDVFEHFFRKHQPNFCTFFSNSTAHYQHAYWRHMEPEKFEVELPEDERRRFEGAIKYGYQQMDKLLHKMFVLEKRSGAKLMLASALSQQPYLAREDEGGQHFYRPLNVQKLLDRIGAPYSRFEPVMTHQYVLHTDDAVEADQAVARLEAVLLDARPVFNVIRESDNRIYFGCHLSEVVASDCFLTLPGDAEPVPFDSIFYQIDGIKSGFHHPDGVLWCKFGNPKVCDEKVSIIDIFPTIVEYFGLSKARAADRNGTSLYSTITAQSA